MLIDIISPESKDFRSLIAIPFGLWNRTRRSIINGTLWRVAFNVGIYNAFACTGSIYLILHDPILSRHVWNSMSLPLRNTVLLPFNYTETLPIYIVCVVFPLLCALGLYAINRYYTREVQESALDRRYRGGDQYEESKIEKDGLTIEFMPIFDDKKREFSIFVPVSKVHTQGKILEIIDTENFDKKLLACIPYVSSCTIIIVSVCARCYFDESIKPYLLITFLIALLIMVIKSLCILYMQDNKIDHKDNCIRGTGDVSIFPINIFCTFKEARMSVVVKNKGKIDENGLLPVLVGNRNASYIAETLKCSSDITSRTSKAKNILTGVIGPETAEEIQSVLRNLNNILKKEDLSSWIMGPEGAKKFKQFFESVVSFLNGERELQTNPFCALSHRGIGARMVESNTQVDGYLSRFFEHINFSAFSDDNDSTERECTLENMPVKSDVHVSGRQTGGQTSSGSDTEQIQRSTVGTMTTVALTREVGVQTENGGSEEQAANNGQPQKEEVKNVRHYLSEYLKSLKKNIKFKCSNNDGTERECTLENMSVKIVIHKTNYSEIIINTDENKEESSSQKIKCNTIKLDTIRWIESGIISKKEVGCIQAAWNNR